MSQAGDALRRPALFHAVLLVPAVALATQATWSADAGTLRFWLAFGAVQACAGWGYTCSSLRQWAGWVDKTGGEVAVMERRLALFQGVAIAFLAGNIAYYGGYYYAGLSEIVCFIGAAVSAYGGDKFLSPLLSRITGKVSGERP